MGEPSLLSASIPAVWGISYAAVTRPSLGGCPPFEQILATFSLPQTYCNSYATGMLPGLGDGFANNVYTVTAAAEPYSEFFGICTTASLNRPQTSPINFILRFAPRGGGHDSRGMTANFGWTASPPKRRFSDVARPARRTSLGVITPNLGK